MSVEIFSMPLAANESREVDVTGEYFELRNAVQPVALIELLDRSGGVRSRLKDPEQSDYVRPGPYEKIRVTNGAYAQTVRFFYGSGDAGSRRTSGVVEVIDGGRSRTLAGVVFGARLPVAVGTAGTRAGGQIWNPAGSGKRMIVSSYYANSTGPLGSVLVGLGNIAAASMGANPPKPKYSGGGPSAMECRFDRVAAGAHLPGSQFFGTVFNGYPVMDREPVVIEPGWGLNFSADNTDCGITVGGHFYEETI